MNIFHPEFSWHSAPTVAQLRQRLSCSAHALPRLRRLAPYWLQRLVGFFHERLIPLSLWYCRWYGIQCPGPQVWPLPFGLLLKHSDGTRIEEVVATRAVYDAGLPVPKIISYGAHPHPKRPVSILMTQLPGFELFDELWDCFDNEQQQTIVLSLKEMLRFIRGWGRQGDARAKAICSIMGTSIRSHRVPFGYMEPCADEAEFNRRLIEPADTTTPQFEDRMIQVRKLEAARHRVVFSHGDLVPHNILVTDDGRLGGPIDWETAGYYPEYWEYTTAWCVATHGWWFDIVHELADGRFHDEREADADRWTVTNGTMIS